MFRFVILLIPYLLVSVTALAALPTDIILVIDNSGSMKQNDPGFLTRETVANFVNKLDDQQRAGLLLFGTQARVVSDLAPRQQLSKAISQGLLENIDFRDQWTDTAAALEMALYEHKMSGRPEANPVIVLLTDGIVDTGDAEDSRRRRDWIIGGLAQQAKQANVRIFAIAFTQAADFELLQSLAQGTGADYYRIIAAADMAVVFDKITTALNEQTFASATEPADGYSNEALEEFALDFSDLERPLAPDSPIDPTDMLVAEPSPKPAEIPVFPGRSQSGPAPETTKPADSVAATIAESDEFTHSNVLVYSIASLALLALLATGIWRWLRVPKTDRSAPEALLHDIDRVSGSPTIDISGATTRIGRAPGRASWLERPRMLVLENVGISRFHATLEYRDEGYWLVDQNSKNGCMINHERARLPRRLQSGDKIHIAKLEFIFELPHPEESDQTVLFGQ